MSVHYKFKSTLDFDTITFDGLHISVGDLKKAIIQQKRLGKITDFDLQIINAQTKEEYNEDAALIPKNTSLVIARVPIVHQAKKPWELQNADKTIHTKNSFNVENSTLDLSTMNGSEEEKIQAMMFQSTADYDPKSYQRIKGQSQVGEVPANYRCNKCKKGGHWIKNCPFIIGKEHIEVKRNTGIPRSFLEKPEKPIDETASESFSIMEEKQEIPEDLICSICKDLFTDAVMIPCCGSSFCDDCVRSALLESEDNECPDCKEKGTSPGSLIPNRFLRNSVNAFKNETGYRPKQIPKVQLSDKTEQDIAQEKVSDVKDVSPPKEIEEKSKEWEDVKQTESIIDNIESFESNKITPIETMEKKLDSPLHEDIESDYEDNITVTMPPVQVANQRLYRERIYNTRQVRHPKPPGIENSPCNHMQQLPLMNTQSEIRPPLIHNVEWEQDYNSADHMKHRNPGVPPPGLITPYPMNEVSDHSIRPMNDIYPNHMPRVCPYPPMPPHPQMMQGPTMQAPPMNSFDGIYNQMGPRPPMGYQSYIRPLFHNERPGFIPLRGGTNEVRHSMHSSNLAHVYQGVAAKVGTGIIDDPLEAFNRIMKEKEKRKAERRRLPDRRRSRSIERHQRPRARLSPYPHRSAKDSYLKDNRRRSREREQRRDNGSDLDKPLRHKRSGSFSDKSSRSGSWSNSPPRKRSKSPIRGRRSRSRPYNFSEKQNKSYGGSHIHHSDNYLQQHYTSGNFTEKDSKPTFSSSSNYDGSHNPNSKYVDHQGQKRYAKRYGNNSMESLEPPPPGFEGPGTNQENLWSDNTRHQSDQSQLIKINKPDNYEKHLISGGDRIRSPMDDSKLNSRTHHFQNDTDCINTSKLMKSNENVKSQSDKYYENNEKSERSDKRIDSRTKEDTRDKDKKNKSIKSVGEEFSKEKITVKQSDEVADIKNIADEEIDEMSFELRDNPTHDTGKLDRKMKDRKRKKERKEKGERKKVKKDKKDKRERSKHKFSPKEFSPNRSEIFENEVISRQSLERNGLNKNSTEDSSKPSNECLSPQVTKESKIDFTISETNPEDAKNSIDTQRNKNLSELQRLDSVLDINDYETDFGETNYHEQERNSNIVLIPERSKWECDEPSATPSFPLSRKSELNENVIENDKVTTEVLRKAENAIFTRAINAIRSVEKKKLPVGENQKLNINDPEIDSKSYQEASQSNMKTFKITVPANESQERSVEIKSDVKKKSTSPKPVKSVKDRLGSKVISKSTYFTQSSSRGSKTNLKGASDSTKKINKNERCSIVEKKEQQLDPLNIDKDFEIKNRNRDNKQDWSTRNNRPGSGRKEGSVSPDRKYKSFRGGTNFRRDRDNRRINDNSNRTFHNKPEHRNSRERGRNIREDRNRHSNDRQHKNHSRGRSLSPKLVRRSSTDRDNMNENKNNKGTKRYEHNYHFSKEKYDHQKEQNQDKNNYHKDSKKLESAITEKSTTETRKIKNPFSNAPTKDNEKNNENANNSTSESSSGSENGMDTDSDGQKRKKKRKYKKDKKRVKRSMSVESSNLKRKHKKRAKSAKKKKKSKK